MRTYPACDVRNVGCGRTRHAYGPSGGYSDWRWRLAGHPLINTQQVRRFLLDDAYREFLPRQQPVWDEVFRSLDVQEEVWIQAAFPDLNAIAWRRRPAGGKSFRIDGSFEVLPGGNPQMNLLLGRPG